ncbi:MAG: proline dehydrogenase family protein, partial [Thermaerobacterales bacterium]
RGMMATLDILGESVLEPDSARSAAAAYEQLLNSIHQSGVDANVSLKLTQFGLSFDHRLALELLRQVTQKARAAGNFVRIDMEDTPYTDLTLSFYRTLRNEGFDNLGVVIQAYLYRSLDDIKGLAVDHGRLNLRLVKGAYDEPPELAYPRKSQVDANFQELIVYCLDHGIYTAIATHDERMIAFTQQHAKKTGVRNDRFEFQTLYGVGRDLIQNLTDQGHRTRVYVPYGEDWYPYFVRRLAERPANLGFMLRSLFRR